jgi:hypothetical protein
MKKSIYIKTIMIILFLSYAFGELHAQEPKVYFTVKGRKVSIVIGKDIALFGLYISDTTGKFERYGWKNAFSNDIAVDKKSNGKNIFLACGNGVMRSTDAGKNWKILTTWELTEASKVMIDPKDSKTIYTTTCYGVWKTTDFGETWSKKINGLKITSQTYTCCIDISPINTKVVYVGTADGVMISKDGGDSWKESGLQGREINCIKICPYDENIILAATENHGVYITKDGGKIWKQINFGLFSMTYYSVAFDPVTKGTVYCGGYKCGVSKSTDFGEKWEKLDNEIFDKDVYTIAIYEKNPNIIFTGGMDWGLWRSDNAGVSFKCIAENDGKIWDIFVE